jgi:hypothetical protein
MFVGEAVGSCHFQPLDSKGATNKLMPVFRKTNQLVDAFAKLLFR